MLRITSHQTVYKIVRIHQGRYISAFTPVSASRIYEVGIPTYAEGNMLLLTFQHRENAGHFMGYIGMRLGNMFPWELWRAEAGVVRPVERLSDTSAERWEEFWNKQSWGLTRPAPAGTLGCQYITLVKRIPWEEL
jgi:hypothetical protein